ncbi:MAG TPA: hypothetical protein VGO22_09205 [Pseudorhizobium sp.]|jgi:hypothetical protein|nr:hypothetical protein [Pseudorhizobium sp.]
MILHRPQAPSAEIKEEVAALVVLHGPEGAWLEARDGLRDALENAHWLDEDELHRRSRYWHGIIREIERQTGYQHQSDTATGYLER